MMFLREPFQKSDLLPHDASHLDLPGYLQQAKSDQVFGRLVRDYLLKLRKTQNEQRNRPYKSFPPKSLVMVRDFRQKAHKKIKPSYYKAPFMVVTEYRCTLYVSDLSGRISKVSKNNVKTASIRSFELFANLPDEIQMILGHPLDPDEWLKIKDMPGLPPYLEEIEIYTGMDRTLRGNLPNDTHLIEQDPEAAILENNTEIPENEADPDDDIFELITQGKLLDQLKELHNIDGLPADVTLNEIPKLHEKMIADRVLPDLMLDDDVLPDVVAPREPLPLVDTGHGADVHPDNILPPGTRRRVQFDVP
jgi:hypothetical protein